MKDPNIQLLSAILAGRAGSRGSLGTPSRGGETLQDLPADVLARMIHGLLSVGDEHEQRELPSSERSPSQTPGSGPNTVSAA